MTKYKNLCIILFNSFDIYLTAICLQYNIRFSVPNINFFTKEANMSYKKIKEAQLLKAIRLYINKLTSINRTPYDLSTRTGGHPLCDHHKDLPVCYEYYNKVSKFRKDAKRVLYKYRVSTNYIGEWNSNLYVVETLIAFDNALRSATDKEEAFADFFPRVAYFCPGVCDIKSLLKACKIEYQYALIATLWKKWDDEKNTHVN